MHKIYFPVFGSGLGHVSRIYDIAGTLRDEESEYLFSTFDEAFHFLKAKGEKVYLCPSIDLKWTDYGGFSSRGSTIRFPFALSAFSKQVGFELGKISKFNPNVVVSDSRLSAVFAAKLKSYSIITILNQFKILFPPRFRNEIGSGLLERLAGNTLGLFWSFSNEVLIPDLPPPYTISEANIAGSDVSNKVKFVGFIVPRINPSEKSLAEAKTLLGLDSRPLVVMQISGPGATKSQLTRIALDSADALVKNFNVVISMGDPNGSCDARKLSNGSWLFEWCPIRDELLALSDVIVARSGHGTISHCINFGKPAVYVPIFNHSEQIWNAEKCQTLGIGISLRSEYSNPRRLTECIESCIDDPKYKQSARRIQSVSNQYNGIESATKIIRSYI